MNLHNNIEHMKKNQHILHLIIGFTLLLASCKKDNFTQQGMAEDHFNLNSGNQQMPVTVAGNVDSKKFVIVIHGGPGGTAIAYRDSYVKDLVERQVTMVYWDQRFAGNTQGNNGASGVEQFRQDLKNLLILLRAKYGNDKKFYLMGHSWGGFLTPYFLAHESNQNMVSGWIQVDGAHNYRMNDSLTREMLLHYGNLEIQAGHQVDRWTDIVSWCENNGFEGSYNAGQLNSFAHEGENLISDVYEPEADYGLEIIKQNALLTQWTNGLSSGLLQIDGPTYVNPNSDKLHLIKLPTLIMWGKYDFVCPHQLADDVMTHVGSLDVQLKTYNHSGHSPMMNERVPFWTDLLEWVDLH